MTATEKAKRTFRQSAIWKAFRHKKNVEQKGLCYLTHKKLLKGANLHHLDLNADHYEDVSDPTHFVFLNKQAHDAVHFLYRYYVKDPSILDRLKEILDRMVELNK